MSSRVVSNLGSLKLLIEAAAQKGLQAATQQMEKEADAIRDIGKAQAPVLEDPRWAGTPLEDSIHVDKVSAPGSTKFVISAGGIVGGVDVDKYAMAMHEGIYQLGLQSIAKEAEVGRVVGRKFLERAYDERKPLIVDNITAAVRESLA